MDAVKQSLNSVFKGIAPVPNSPRTMKFPYTLGAQIAQFPHNFYWKHNWNYKYYLIAVAVCTPIFYKINKLANSPENVAKWKEIRRKEREESHH